MKRLAVIIPALIILIVAAALIGPSFIDWNQHKATIEQQVKAHTDLDLKLNGKLSLSLLPFPRVSASDIMVHAPEKGHYESILSLKRIDVGLEMLPLLSGTIAVQSLNLVEPKIALEMGAEGKLSAITPKIEAQMNGEGQAAPAPQSSSAMPAISFEHIGIENGQFALYDANTKQETLVENISGTLKAGTLLGPYEADLALLNQGRIITLDVKTETYNPETKIVSAKVDAELQPGNIKAQYAGAFDLSKGFAAQGQMEIVIEELGKTLLANNIIATQDAVQGKFEAKGFLNADAKKAEIRQFEASVADQKISGQVDINYEPMSIAANLKSENKLDLQKFLAAYPGLKTASFDLDFKGDQKSVSISKATVALNDEPYALSGDYVFNNKSDRSELTINFSGEELDLSVFDSTVTVNSNDKSTNKNDSLKSAEGVSLPLDVVFAIKLNNVSYQGQKFTNFSVKGEAVQNALKIDALSFNGYDGAQLALAGQVKDLTNLSGLSAIGSAEMKDLKATVDALGADTAQIPAGIKSAAAKFKITGDMSAVDATLNFSASNGEVIAQGRIASPSTTPTIQELTLQLKHRSMDEAIRLFSGSTDKNPAFSKPFDVFAKIRQSESGAYELSGLKGDLSGMKVQGDMVLDTAQQKPSLKGDLRFENINLGGSGSSQGGASSQGASSGKGKAQSGSRWSKDPIDLSGLNAFDADLKISAGVLTSGSWIINEPKMVLLIKDGTLTVQDLQGGLFGGNLALTSTVQASAQARQPSHIDAQGSLENVDLAALVKALAGSNIVKASGRVSTDIDLKTSGLSMAAFVYDLSGKGSVSGSDIVLDGVDVKRFAVALSEESKAGDTVMGIWKGASKGGSTTFETLEGNFDIVEGIVGINKLDLDGPQASIFTTGKIDLPNWTVSTRHKLTAKTRPDVPPFEMAFSGPLDNPAQTFGQGVLNDYLQRKVERKVNKLLSDKLSDKIGIPFGNQPQQPQPQAQEVPQEPNDIAPADGQSAPEEPAAQAEQPEPQQEEPQNLEEMKPEDAIKGVLKGLLE